MATYIVKLNDACNMRCTYCYYIDPATGLGPNHGGKLPLSDARQTVDRIATDAISRGQRHIDICWHGGEPLLNGHNYFRSLLSYVSSEWSERLRIRQRVQTNLLLMDAEFADLFKRYSVRIGTSVDGPARIHDSQRVDSRGRGTFHRVAEGIQLCRSRELSVSALTVIRPDMCGRSLFDTHYDLGIRNFDFLLPDSNLTDPPSAAPRDFAKVLTDAFDAWQEKADSKCRINSFESIIRRLAGREACHCTNMRKCHEFLSVETSSNWGICDTLRGCGQKFQETALSVREADVDALKATANFETAVRANQLSAKCQSCEIVDYCGGGCAQSRWDGSSLMNTSVWCEAYWILIHHIMESLVSRPMAQVRHVASASPIHVN